MKRTKQWLFTILTVVLIIVAGAIGKVISEGFAPPVAPAAPLEQAYLNTIVVTANETARINSEVIKVLDDFANGQKTTLATLFLLATYKKEYQDLLTRFGLAYAPPDYEGLRKLLIQNITLHQEQLDALSQYVKTGDSTYLSVVKSFEANIQQSGASITGELNRLRK